jgi:hypothetical protein
MCRVVVHCKPSDFDALGYCTNISGAIRLCTPAGVHSASQSQAPTSAIKGRPNFLIMSEFPRVHKGLSDLTEIGPAVEGNDGPQVSSEVVLKVQPVEGTSKLRSHAFHMEGADRLKIDSGRVEAEAGIVLIRSTRSFTTGKMLSDRTTVTRNGGACAPKCVCRGVAIHCDVMCRRVKLTNFAWCLGKSRSDAFCWGRRATPQEPRTSTPLLPPVAYDRHLTTYRTDHGFQCAPHK